jgi:hypothetical protein
MHVVLVVTEILVMMVSCAGHSMTWPARARVRFHVIVVDAPHAGRNFRQMFEIL